MIVNWLRRKVVAWLLTEISSQQSEKLRVQVKICVAEGLEQHVRDLPARIRGAQLRRA